MSHVIETTGRDAELTRYDQLNRDRIAAQLRRAGAQQIVLHVHKRRPSYAPEFQLMRGEQPLTEAGEKPDTLMAMLCPAPTDGGDDTVEAILQAFARGREIGYDEGRDDEHAWSA